MVFVEFVGGLGSGAGGHHCVDVLPLLLSRVLPLQTRSLVAKYPPTFSYPYETIVPAQTRSLVVLNRAAYKKA